MFSTSSLTEEEARLIADAYFRGEKDPVKMRNVLQVEHLDMNVIMHPLVRRFIVAKQLEMSEEYSLSDHLAMLKQIRNGAMEDENWKIALTAEVALGKAAGLYEPKVAADAAALADGSGKPIDPASLSTDELRKRLAAAIGAQLPPPSPDPVESMQRFDDSMREDHDDGLV